MVADSFQFVFDKRLGISVPHFDKDWEDYTFEEQHKIIDLWEKERAKIPDRVKEIEQEILDKQEMMFKMSFEDYVELHKEIVDMSSAINDLNIWFRTHGEISNE